MSNLQHSYYRDKNPYSGSQKQEYDRQRQENQRRQQQYQKFYQDFKNTKFYDNYFKDFAGNFGGTKYENMYERWKRQRKVEKEEKQYKAYVPGDRSPFNPVNRRRIMNMLGKYTNFFRIVNIHKGKTDYLFMQAKQSFKTQPNKETFARGVLTWKDFTRMFPFRGVFLGLFGMSLFYRGLVR